MIEENSAIQYYDDMLPRDICQEIIDGFNKNEGKLVHPSEIRDDGTVDNHHRNSLQIQLDDEKLLSTFGSRSSALSETVLTALSLSIQRYNIDISGLVSRLSNWGYDQIDILKYERGVGHYDTHIDNDGSRSIGDRLFSIILYLNDVDLGGGTHFPLQNKIVQPMAGRVVLFPSNFVFPHSAHIPFSDDKYVIVAWVKALHNLKS